MAVKMRKSKRQKRREKMGWTARIGLEQQGLESCDIDPNGDFLQLQKEDAGLQDYFGQAAEVQQGQMAGEGYFLRDRVLYYKANLEDRERLVVPQTLRDQVLELGHSIPWAGHLGAKKTLDRIASRFYWPGLHTEVQDYCQSCPVCQLAGAKNVPRFPLQPLPIIDVPFSRIAMDIVGPLERTQSGHRYILVICDYSTRYPEAFPLRDITAKQIAYALLQLFSRVGIPSEILTDQGTNFLSNTLRQVYRLLGIRGIRTTPYHPQTDGLVERYNRTLKSMLKKFISSNAKDWDKWLPYLLFAYREVPQASTGFSPFELLYGRQVRGPLDVLQETWVGSQEKRTSVLTYVLQMREKMEQTTRLVKKHMEKAQRCQRTWYDQAARERSFSPGQQVLLLLPTVENKLLAKWQGPYNVLRKLSATTYEIEMPDRRNPKQTFHINLLKEWKTREIPPQQQMFVRAVEEEDDVVSQFAPAAQNSASLDLSHLSVTSQQELQAIIPPDLFQEKPGATTLVEHSIQLKDSTPVRQRMYRIPQKLVPVLEEEIAVMLELGVIEPSTSEWSNPIVLVLKKDGSIRFCIDFRKVNAQSAFDAYPLPRLDDLIERVGQARFITTLDLCKGYWQVPLANSAKPLTAFRTPQGLFQFTKMPFGLHGAPATFQRLMNQVLAGMDTFAASYLDDVVIFSNSWKEHLSHLEMVLGKIKQAGLTINPKKCALVKQETQYLGYILGGGVIKPVQDKVEAIRARERPTTRKQVKSFLGLVGWYRRFIPNFSTRAAPLTDLTSTAKAHMVWGEEQENAFQDLKEVLCQEPVLQSPNFTLPFSVQTDASRRGLGGVLLQGDGDERKPVAYISRKLFPRETRYSAVELECLSIKWAVDTFKYYLLGREFTLETDHRALQWLEQMKDTNSRITRWFLSLQPYRFSIHYRPGKQNTVADFLSRNVVGESANTKAAET
uniref:Gypsy retrotransposon integrase-like protein 1 n=1 Tax=Acanthochromis polyacanthus TaxID=80966 RepID=A0A3Q1GC55_9TELE